MPTDTAAPTATPQREQSGAGVAGISPLVVPELTRLAAVAFLGTCRRPAWPASGA